MASRTVHPHSQIENSRKFEFSAHQRARRLIASGTPDSIKRLRKPKQTLARRPKARRTERFLRQRVPSMFQEEQRSNREPSKRISTKHTPPHVSNNSSSFSSSEIARDGASESPSTLAGAQSLVGEKIRKHAHEQQDKLFAASSYQSHAPHAHSAAAEECVPESSAVQFAVLPAQDSLQPQREMTNVVDKGGLHNGCASGEMCIRSDASSTGGICIRVGGSMTSIPTDVDPTDSRSRGSDRRRLRQSGKERALLQSYYFVPHIVIEDEDTVNEDANIGIDVSVDSAIIDDDAELSISGHNEVGTMDDIYAARYVTANDVQAEVSTDDAWSYYPFDEVIKTLCTVETYSEICDCTSINMTTNLGVVSCRVDKCNTYVYHFESSKRQTSDTLSPYYRVDHVQSCPGQDLCTDTACDCSTYDEETGSGTVNCQEHCYTYTYTIVDSVTTGGVGEYCAYSPVGMLCYKQSYSTSDDDSPGRVVECPTLDGINCECQPDVCSDGDSTVRFDCFSDTDKSLRVEGKVCSEDPTIRNMGCPNALMSTFCVKPTAMESIPDVGMLSDDVSRVGTDRTIPQVHVKSHNFVDIDTDDHSQEDVFTCDCVGMDKSSARSAGLLKGLVECTNHCGDTYSYYFPGDSTWMAQACFPVFNVHGEQHNATLGGALLVREHMLCINEPVIHPEEYDGYIVCPVEYNGVTCQHCHPIVCPNSDIVGFEFRCGEAQDIVGTTCPFQQQSHTSECFEFTAISADDPNVLYRHNVTQPSNGTTYYDDNSTIGSTVANASDGSVGNNTSMMPTAAPVLSGRPSFEGTSNSTDGLLVVESNASNAMPTSAWPSQIPTGSPILNTTTSFGNNSDETPNKTSSSAVPTMTPSIPPTIDLASSSAPSVAEYTTMTNTSKETRPEENSSATVETGATIAYESSVPSIWPTKLDLPSSSPSRMYSTAPSNRPLHIFSKWPTALPSQSPSPSSVPSPQTTGLPEDATLQSDSKLKGSSTVPFAGLRCTVWAAVATTVCTVLFSAAA